jgi:sugar O-acyltransferase (sialic acid O-acetyltransferase NeuD family)
MTCVVILGAGAHAREILEILRQPAADKLKVVGFIDDNPGLHGQRIDDAAVLGDWSWFEGVDRREVGVISGSGFSKTRKQMVEKALSLSLKFVNAISPAASISPSAKVGEGVVLYANTTVSRGSFIDDHVAINVGAIVGHDTRVDAYGTLNPGVNLAGNVRIGEGCLLGIGCSVIQGMTIGAWSTIGAGAVVIRNLPDNVTAVGVPARIIETTKNEETITPD